jgi:menaquinone-dependent protoporphyrinogen IX oxidase
MGRNIAVIYKSKYGSTKKYAEWIAEATGAELLEASRVKPPDLVKYDTIVYGGALYAVGIMGIGLIRDNFQALKDKRIVVFSVGAALPEKENMDEVRNRNFTDEMRENTAYFHLRGAFNFKKLSLLHKIMIRLLELKIRSKKGELRNDEKGMLAVIRHPADWTNKKAVQTVLDYINGENPRI